MPDILNAIRTHGSCVISEATLRMQDLIPAFMDALEDLDEDRWYGLAVKYSQNGMPALFEFEDGVPVFIEDMMDGEDAGYLLDDLFNALEEAAPDGYWFGAHPGDGACFGFWIVEDDPNYCPKCGSRYFVHDDDGSCPD